MKTIVYLPDHNQEHIDTLTAFAEGCDCEVRNIDAYKPSDIAVVFGIGKKDIPSTHARGKILYKQKMLGNKTIVLEKGYIKRDKYYAAGFDGLNGRADFNNENMPSDRWEELGVHLSPMKNIEEGKVFKKDGRVTWRCDCSAW